MLKKKIIAILLVPVIAAFQPYPLPSVYSVEFPLRRAIIDGFIIAFLVGAVVLAHWERGSKEEQN